MINVNMKMLCEWCRGYNRSEWDCDYIDCKDMKDMYLADHGITETTEPQEAKTFRSISTNDKIYVITENDIIPKIKEFNIGFIRKHENSGLCIETDGDRIIISPANMDKSKTLIYFLLKTDCKKRLDAICTTRIAILQKILDTK